MLHRVDLELDSAVNEPLWELPLIEGHLCATGLPCPHSHILRHLARGSLLMLSWQTCFCASEDPCLHGPQPDRSVANVAFVWIAFISGFWTVLPVQVETAL